MDFVCDTDARIMSFVRASKTAVSEECGANSAIKMEQIQRKSSNQADTRSSWEKSARIMKLMCRY